MRLAIKFTLFVMIASAWSPAMARALMEGEEARFQNFASKFCRSLAFNINNGNDGGGQDLDDLIISFVDREENASFDEMPGAPHSNRVAAFLNRYSSRIICRNELDSYPAQHWMIRVIRMNGYESILVQHYLSDNERYPIDLNIVTFESGKPQTVLDYIDALLGLPDAERRYYAVVALEELRDIAVEFYGAKTAAELGFAEVPE